MTIMQRVLMAMCIADPAWCHCVQCDLLAMQDEIDKVRKRQAEREAEKARREEELVRETLGRGPPACTWGGSWGGPM